MRTLLFVAFLLLAPFTHSATELRATLVAEFGDDLSRPHDAAISPDGERIYLTDMRNSRIRVLEAMSLRPLAIFGEGELSYPHDAEFDARGRLLVADTGNDRVAIYDLQQSVPRLAGELRGLSGPEGVAVTADGRVLVTSTRSGTISIFRDGLLERSVGRRGDGDGEFSNPHDIEVADDGMVYVIDSGNNRVQVLDAALGHHTSFGTELGLNGPKYLAFDTEDVWLADEYNHRILKLDRDHRLAGILGSGQRGRGANAFYQPEAVLARAPYVWVIDTYNDRIVLLRVD